jgi:hypothetical protein
MEECFSTAQCSECPNCRLCAAQRTTGTLFLAQLCCALDSPAVGLCSYSSSPSTKRCISVPTAVTAHQRTIRCILCTLVYRQTAYISAPGIARRVLLGSVVGVGLPDAGFTTTRPLLHVDSRMGLLYLTWICHVGSMFSCTPTFNTSHCIALRYFAKMRRPVTSVQQTFQV